MRSSIVALVALVVVTLALPSRAQAGDREHVQEQRIADGVAAGEVTAREGRHLEAQQKRIDKRQRRAKRNGVVSPAEQRRLDRAQDRAGRDIHRATHNACDAK
jgi:hypothetical protein